MIGVLVPVVRGIEPGRRSALLVVEVQNGITNIEFVDTPLAREVAARGVLPRIRALADAFRAAGAPVIFCTIAAASPDWNGFRVNCALAARVRRTGLLVTGAESAAVHPALVVEETDVVSHRTHGMSPFTGTELDATLRGFDIDTVVLSGVSTNIALPGAATEAVGYGYSVVLAEDCTAGASRETHEFQVANHLPLLATVTDSASIIESLRALPPQGVA